MRVEHDADREAWRVRDADHRGAPPAGARQLNALLPNGKTIWLRVDAPLAPIASLDHVARLAERAMDGRDMRIGAHARTTGRLGRLVAADIARMNQARRARARALGRRIAAGDNRLDARLSKARDELRSRIDTQVRIDRENFRRLRRRDLWDKILLATALPLFAAYGDRRNPLGSSNLTLVFLLIIWLVGDEVVEAVFGSDHAKSPHALSDTDAWSYLAPIGNVLAAWWLLGDRQHERFVTGVTTVKLDARDRHHVDVKLSERIAVDHYADFETFAGVPVVATAGAMRRSSNVTADPRIEGLKARVREGVLTLSFRVVSSTGLPLPADAGEVDIAWMVDTDEPRSARHGS